MVKIDPNELLTVAQAAAVRGVTRQAINYLIREGKLPSIEIAGRRFVKTADVESFVPDKGGRPVEDKTSSKKGGKK
jgi:excisionase family DNA binding protein